MRTGEMLEYERESITPTGTASYVTVQFPLKDAAGDVYALVSMSTDVHGPQASAGRGGRGLALEVRVPGQHEPRDPHAAQRRDRDDRAAAPDRARHRAARVRAHGGSSGEALLGMINDILDFSKIEAGKLELDAHEFDLREAVEDTCEMLAAQAHGKALELTAFVAEDVPAVVRGDPAVCGRSSRTSSRTRSSSPTVVRWPCASSWSSARAATRSLRFEVADSGIGIEPAKLATLFESFSQADTSTTRRYGGTGLGLAISRQLVSLMHGEIGADVRARRGEPFPLHRPPAGAGDRSPGAPPAWPSPAGLNVLVVDDNATNREIVRAYLRSSDVRCELADSGAAALAAMHAAARAGEPFEIVVLDAQMPEMDGLDLAAAIRQAPSLRETSLVMLTSTGEHRARARELGITGYLTKPVRRARLLDALADVAHGERAGGDRGWPRAGRRTRTWRGCWSPRTTWSTSS